MTVISSRFEISLRGGYCDCWTLVSKIVATQLVQDLAFLTYNNFKP